MIEITDEFRDECDYYKKYKPLKNKVIKFES